MMSQIEIFSVKLMTQLLSLSEIIKWTLI